MSGLCDRPSVCGTDGGAMAAERIINKKARVLWETGQGKHAPPSTRSLNTCGFNWVFIFRCRQAGTANLRVWGWRPRQNTFHWGLSGKGFLEAAAHFELNSLVSQTPSAVTGEKWMEIGYSGSVCTTRDLMLRKSPNGTQNNTTLEPAAETRRMHHMHETNIDFL